MHNTSFAIKTPRLLHLADTDGNLSYGANQTWYTTEWQRRAGCGPTVFAHLAWYLAHTRAFCAPLCPYSGSTRADFLPLMEDSWNYITPGHGGVNTTGKLTTGALRYAADRQVPLRPAILEIPPVARFRPAIEQLSAFLAASLCADLPVAFLNLSNGALPNLDHWHWVTLIAFDPANLAAVMYDQSRCVRIDLGLWLRTTLLGGGLVAMEPVN